jgi:hypothetical protein
MQMNSVRMYVVFNYAGKLFFKKKKKKKTSLLPMTQIYNPSYLGGWDQEDQGLRQKVSETPFQSIGRVHVIQAT